MGFHDKSLIEKEDFKFTQAQEIADNSIAIFNKLGKDEFYKMMTRPIPADTKDILQRCYLWLLDKYYNHNKGYALDAGCGVGPFVLRLESMGYNATGLDMYLSKINVCEVLRKSYPNKKIDFTQGTVYRMPYYTRWFDVCHSTMVMEHLRDPLTGLKEMARVARTVTGIVHLGKHIDDSPWHTWFMTKEELVRLLNYCKQVKIFKNYEITYIDTDICAVFKAETYPLERKVGKCFVKDVCGAEIDVDSIVCAKVDKHVKWVDSYMNSIKLKGRSVAEDGALPIRVDYNLEKKTYRQHGDGVHRINALRRAGIEKVRAIVSYISEGSK